MGGDKPSTTAPKESHGCWPGRSRTALCACRGKPRGPHAALCPERCVCSEGRGCRSQWGLQAQGGPDHVPRAGRKAEKCSPTHQPFHLLRSPERSLQRRENTILGICGEQPRRCFGRARICVTHTPAPAFGSVGRPASQRHTGPSADRGHRRGYQDSDGLWLWRQLAPRLVCCPRMRQPCRRPNLCPGPVMAAEGFWEVRSPGCTQALPANSWAPLGPRGLRHLRSPSCLGRPRCPSCTSSRLKMWPTSLGTDVAVGAAPSRGPGPGD